MTKHTHRTPNVAELERNAPRQSSASGPEQAEDRYFDAILAGDAQQLEQLLTEDFLIVDVTTGAAVDQPTFIAAVRDRVLEFEHAWLVQRATRRYGDTAIIVGRTEMAGSFAGVAFAAASRYTHVLLRDPEGRWRLATAQGTRISDGEPSPE